MPTRARVTAAVLGITCSLAVATITGQSTANATFDPPVTPTHDANTVLLNPNSGLTITYDDNKLDGTDSITFFTDPRVTPVLSKVSTVLIRTTWARLQPTATSYAWNAPSAISNVLQRAKDRNLRVALQVTTDSTGRTVTGGQATPGWVFTNGAAKGTATKASDDSTRLFDNPDVNDLKFRGSYKSFITELGGKFNTPDLVASVNGVGIADTATQDTWNDVTSAYRTAFPAVPLTLDYKYGQQFLDTSINYGYVPKVTSLGLPDPKLMQKINTMWPAHPVFGESAFTDYNSTLRSSHYQSADTALKSVLRHATGIHASTLNIGTPAAIDQWWKSQNIAGWALSGEQMVNWAALNIGYRLAPTTIAFDNDTPGSIGIQATWRNSGSGILVNSQSTHKYRVAYALLDKNTQQVVTVNGVQVATVDTNDDPGVWTNRQDVPVTSSLTIPSGTPGAAYDIGVAIVYSADATESTKTPRIQLGLPQTPSKWYPVGSTTVS